MDKENKARIVKIGLALALAAAAGFYLDLVSRSDRTTDATAAGAGEALRLLHEPRPLPDIALSDGGGRPITLASFRGRVVLLNIWATWCVPCRKEMPALDRLQARLGGPKFEVVALSVDGEGLAAVNAYYLQTGIKRLGAYADSSGTALAALGLAGIPTTLFIDRQGNELARKIGAAEWDSAALVKAISDQLDAPAIPAVQGAARQGKP